MVNLTPQKLSQVARSKITPAELVYSFEAAHADTVIGPKLSERSTNEIINLAEDTAKQRRYQFDGDIESVVGKMAGLVASKDMWRTGNKSSVVVSCEGDFVVAVSNRGSFRENTFDLAMGVGHRMLHVDSAVSDKHMVVPRYCDDDDKAAKQAMIFAVNFLAPKAEVQRRLDEGTGLNEISGQMVIDQHFIEQQIKQFQL